MSENKDTLIKYKKSPIFLAILEIRYKGENLKDIEKFSEFKPNLASLFPNSQNQITSELKFENLLEGQPKISLLNKKIDCLLYSSANKQTEFSISLDSFNYRQSGEYSDYEHFVENIKKVWEIHYPLLKDILITGISIRCFNKLEIKEEVKDPNEYFNVSIQASSGVINEVVTNFSLRYVTNNFQNRTHSIVALSLENSLENYFPFVLDIDVHDDNRIENNLDLLWMKFEHIRIEKDKLFNALLTEKTKSLLI